MQALKEMGSLTSSDSDENEEKPMALGVGPGEYRSLGLSGAKGKHPSNEINNQKYSVLNFLPIVLFNQFKIFFNFFQLMLVGSQFVPLLKVGFLFSYLAPLVVVLFLTLLKEAYDDFKRYQRDSEANSTRYQAVRKGLLKEIEAKSICPGDIILLRAKERVPADLVILGTSEPSGSIFIKTDQLDGETDWKIRRAIKTTHDFIQGNKSLAALQALPCGLLYDQPHSNIYDFKGRFTFAGGAEPLTLENTAWANTVLAAGEIHGLVVYTGRETRSKMNSKDPTYKLGKLDWEINHLSKVLFVMMACMALLINLFQPLSVLWPLMLFRYVLLLASILPISLRVNMDFGKLVFSYRISNDPLIEGTICRNSTIPEELGRIEYLLTDKTGTLTYNEMSFRRLGICEQVYTNEEIPDMQKLIAKSLSRPRDQDRKNKRKLEQVMRDLATSLAVCNNVTPVLDNGERVLQASSPDEIALVQFAEQLGFAIQDRDNEKVVIALPDGTTEAYRVEVDFPFSSDTKRMGVVLTSSAGRIFFLLKGADMVMINKAKSIYRGYIQDECDNFSRDGLRTLVLCQKELGAEEFGSWMAGYREAATRLAGRQEAILEAMEALETDMDLLGITAVEDKLQDEVANTLEALRMAGLRIWMLTGDKVETAKCIAISAGLKAQNQSIFEIKGTDDLLLREKLLEYENERNSVLLLDGAALTTILEQFKKLFFELARQAPAVICCRCSPAQKATIAEELKALGTVTAAVGDGGNDVGMILQSSYGIGIVGKEGNQASMASDVSLLEFKYLKPLILWHGRNSYKLCSALCQFVLHRGLVISILQMAFTMLFYQVAIPLYNGLLMLGYATVYTSLPVLSILCDEKISRETILKYPNLYCSLRKNREMGVKRFLLWCWVSLYQGAAIMLLSLLLFESSFVQIVTITFSALILSEVLNVATQVSSCNRWILGSMVVTLLIYYLSLVLLKNYLDASRISWQFVLRVLSIVAVSWLPIHLASRLYSFLYPGEEDKIR
jgi:phospholipid-translocating ATPase